MVVASLVLGIISCIAWLVPLLGFPISIVGLCLGKSAMKKGENSKAGVTLSTIGLALVSINSVLGVFMALL